MDIKVNMDSTVVKQQLDELEEQVDRINQKVKRIKGLENLAISNFKVGSAVVNLDERIQRLTMLENIGAITHEELERCMRVPTIETRADET